MPHPAREMWAYLVAAHRTACESASIALEQDGANEAYSRAVSIALNIEQAVKVCEDSTLMSEDERWEEEHGAVTHASFVNRRAFWLPQREVAG